MNKTKMAERDRWLLENIGCENTNISCVNVDNEYCDMLMRYLPKLCEKQPQTTSLETTLMASDNDYYVTLWTIVVPIVFSIIIVIGVFGNALVIYVVFTTPRLKTSTHLFLVNLAISDITFLSICVPFQAYKYAAPDWTFGNLWCQIIQYLLYVTLYVTVWTLVCIAAIRYVILAHGKTKCRKVIERPLVICMGLWLVMLIVHIPTLLAHQVNYYKQKHDEYYYCGIDVASTKQVFLALFICAYVLPLCLICVLYLLVIRYLHAANKKQTQCATRNHTMRVSKVVIAIVLVFSASWLPFHVHSLISYYSHIPGDRYYEILRILWHCMAYSNSLANPFIYNLASSDFRTAFRYVLYCYRCRNRNSNIIVSQDPDKAHNRMELQDHDV